jgi:hypothetical protein
MALSVGEDPHPHLARRGTTARKAPRRFPVVEEPSTLTTRLIMLKCVESVPNIKLLRRRALWMKLHVFA